jgi:Uma2 family endonuclease
MAINQTILGEIRESLDFPHHVRVMNAVLRREEAARRSFRAFLTEGVRAEFINGKVVQLAPARLRHSAVIRRVGTLLDTAVRCKNTGLVHAERALCGCHRNDFCPDICFWRKAKSKRFTPDTMIFPAPDLICEVLSAFTAATDRSLKLDDYAANGVSEYWIADPDREVIQQYVLKGADFVLLGEFSRGSIRSRVIRGFQMPLRAAFDEKGYIAYLKRLLAD